MSAREIKDLAIAREALSRFPGTESQSVRIELIMDELISQMQEERRTQQYSSQTRDPDEIPF